MATFTNGIAQPVCQNCTTSTTPLWRRDESGAVLCNACGLFLKLHGTPRPISLKTDVIKSRNRVKTAGQQAAKRKSFFEQGLPASQSQQPPQQHPQSVLSNGSERSGSPLSRTNTPGLHQPSNIAPQHMFDGVSLSDHPFQSPPIPPFPPRQPSPGSTSSNDRHLEPPQTYEGLVQANNALKTRVNELEVINGLYQQYQQGSQNQGQQAPVAPQAEMLPQRSAAAAAAGPKSEDSTSLRQLLQQSEQREEEMRRRIEDLEREVEELKEQPPAKRARKEEGDAPVYPEPPTSLTAE